MIFRTEIPVKPSTHKISHQSSVITIGSCFAEVIGNRLYTSKFNTLSNPFGTIFNPVSISTLLNNSIQSLPLPDNSYLNSNDTWHNFQLHSSINATTKAGLVENIEKISAAVNSKIRSARFIIITLGTAWVYRHKVLNETVANCHKQHPDSFEKILLQPDEIEKAISSSLELLHSINPNLQAILTVSPVRHIKDTLELNAVSKSVLRISAFQLSQKFSFCAYFPAFEIMMDDLRDYRFYKEDMIHPTAQAEDYIWEKFSNTYFSEQTISLVKKWNFAKKALDHKPLNENSSETLKFLKATLAKVTDLSDHLNVQEEINTLKEKIAKLSS